MKKLVAGILINLFLASFSFAANGTADDAIALTDKAVDYIRMVGKEKAFAEFSNPKGKFIDRDLYIFAIDYNGVVLAHGGNANFVDKNMSGLQDANGLYFIKESIKLAKTRSRGWLDYKWVNPTSKKIEPKSTYIQKMDNYFLGCGIYR